LTVVLAPALLTQAQGAMLDEDFNTVTGTGGGIFLTGSGQSTFIDWDDGVLGETAFGETLVHAHAVMSAQGNPTGGVGGSGAGELEVSNLTFNMLDENFDSVTGTGGGVFLVGDGVTSNISVTTEDWDGGIGGEAAFFETYQGATLDGFVSAQGLPGADGAGQLVVNGAGVPPGGWRAGLSWTIPGFPAEAAAILHNGGFDADGYNPPFGGDFEPMYWTIGGDGYWLQWDWTGNVYLEGGQAPPISAPAVLKMWTAWWTGTANDTFVYQDLAAQEGQTWELDCWTHHITGDSMTDDNRAEMRIECYDPNDTLMTSVVAVILDETSPLDVWIDNTPIQLTVPAGAAYVRAGVAFVDDDPNIGAGAAFYEDVTFNVVSGPPAFDLSQFSLTADVRGEADPNLGEAYGHYQLRLEDEQGNRLAFESAAVANGQWAPIGGALSAAEEQDENGDAASGVFNPGSGTFTAVVAFDNDRDTDWGTGGTLEVDNLFMPNEYVDGSYYAGLFWDDLPVPPTDDPRDLVLSADVKGSVPGGTYQFRLEGFSDIPPVSEDFSTATGVGGVQLISPGGNWGDTADWDTGIDFTHVFAGIDNGVATEPAGGVWVQGTTTDGNPGGAAVLEAHEIALGTNGKWYVGIFWANQGLASDNLANITLTADILGDWNSMFLEEASYYILRFEDPQGDWIGFDGIVTGSWQNIGGPLSTATASGAGDSGDGVFDIDLSASYTVVVVMESASISDWGGTLYVDNVSLTPPPEPVKVERGRIMFNAVADGDFQTVGGLLSEGESTWPGVGGCFWPGPGEIANWDRGLEGEEAFAGTWAAEIGSVCIEGDPTCGVGGSGGGRFTWSGVDAASGYMWLGAAWRLELAQPFDPNQMEIYADVKGTWDPNEGESPGIISVRFEQYRPWIEARLAFDSIADGNYHTVGGPLSTAYQDGDVIDPNADSYSMVIIVHGPRTPTWGPGGTVEFDNVRVIDHGVTILDEDFELVTGPTPGFLNEAGELDSITVTLTMENGAETWGGGGLCPGDLDGDNDIDLADLAQLLGHYGTTSGATYEDGDIDGDGDVDLSDLASLLGVYGDTCEGAATLTVDNLLFDEAP
jgi:hypothetical protein